MAETDFSALLDSDPVDAIAIAEFQISEYRQETAIQRAQRAGAAPPTYAEFVADEKLEEWTAFLKVLRDISTDRNQEERKEAPVAVLESRSGKLRKKAPVMAGPLGAERRSMTSKPYPEAALKQQVGSIFKPRADSNASKLNDEVKGAKSTQESPSNPGPRSSCVVCMDHFRDSALSTMPCDHKYCSRCLRDHFNRSFIDEALFPPRCCQQEIRVDSVVDIIGLNMRNTYLEKKVEFSTKNRVYCSKPSCSRFIPIPAEFHYDYFQCKSCKRKTCLICKKEAHMGDCPEDEGARQLRELTCKKGWKKCPKCNRVVEKVVGCRHIVCVCGENFCYKCGAKMGYCGCQ